MNAGILGVGMAVPSQALTNEDIRARGVDTTDEWIFTRTGIRERRICGPDETTASLGTLAARRAIADAGLQPEDIGLIICATATGDHIWPSTACLIQSRIGCRNAAAFDLGAACSGFVYALETAAGFIRSGAMKHVLVVGADTLTKQINWEDRSTCVLFGDGAGAVALGPCEPETGLLSSALGADGRGFDQIVLPAGGTAMPVTAEVIERRLNCISMRGAEVYKFAVKIMGDACLEALGKAGLTSKDVDLFIPHQANIRIIESAAQRMGLEANRVFINVDRYGNTSAASVPIALCEAIVQGRVHQGDALVFVGFGAGLTWGAAVLRWSRPEPAR
jgi:3-oxoacyl-[acyl-carrier-protein] synthase-3